MQVRSTKKDSLPHYAQKVINQYKNLHLGTKTVITPYFMNEKGKKGRRVTVGKGTAEEIVKETEKLAKKYKFNLQNAPGEKIRDFMIQYEIGIDCSGFITWILNEYTKAKFNKPVWKILKFTMLPRAARIKRYLRPVENISVKVLTHETNSRTITDLKEIHPGDMIRALNGHHILLISEVEYKRNNFPISFKYINSTEYNNVKYGIREGEVIIKDITKYLVDQKWIDEENGVNWVYNAIKDFKQDSRIVRINAFDMTLD